MTRYRQAADREAAAAACFDPLCARSMTISALLEHLDGLNAA